MDKTSSKKAQEMGRVRRAGTTLELRIRRVLTGLGYRYRLNVPTLRGRPDIPWLAKKCKRTCRHFVYAGLCSDRRARTAAGRARRGGRISPLPATEAGSGRL